MHRILLRCMMAAALAATAGCTHAMKVKNLDEYSKNVSTEKRWVLRFVDESVGAESERLADAIFVALKSHPDVDTIVVGSQEIDEPIDALVTVRPTTSYDGSGWNFLITFPGFVLFTHAWNGFIYKANVATEVSVTLPGDTTPRTSTIDAKYDLRHCDFERGAATSSGWYLPGWGATNIIVGLFMINYDTDATGEFLTTAENPYGRYVANSIIGILVNAEPAPSPPEAAVSFRSGCPATEIRS